MAVAPSFEITMTIIDGKPEEYSLVKIPPPTSGIVVSEKEVLLQQVDLKTFAKDLENVGNFVKVAYFGATAAGPEYGKLQVKIKKIGFDVADLCDASAIVIAKFRDSAARVLKNFRATYEYLSDGDVEAAAEVFHGIVEVAKKMREKAEQLQKRFQSQKEEVESTTLETIQQKSAAGEQSKKAEADREIFKREQETQKGELEKAAKEEESAKKSFQAEADQEKKALDDLGDVGFWGAFTGKRGVYRKKADHFSERRKEALDTLNKQCDKREKALAKLQAATRQMIECTEKHEMHQAAVAGLQMAEQGLTDLSVVMRQAAEFWGNMESNCEEMENPTLKLEFQKLKNKPEEVMKRCSKDSFKEGAMELYGRWSALNLVCIEYMQHIKATQSVLYSNIRECPSYEKARSDIDSLAKKVLREADSEQKAIQEKRAEAKKKEEGLGKSQSLND